MVGDHYLTGGLAATLEIASEGFHGGERIE